MWKTCGLVVTVALTFVYTEHLQTNRTAELISTYAKVAHWGATGASNSPSEGRSSGQTLWTHRSDVNIRRGQNLKSKQPVTYYYSMRAPSSKVDDEKLENIPFKGEVQERFNPRPYFDFVFDDSPRQNRRPNAPKTELKQTGTSQNNPKPPAVVYGAPADSFPGLDSLPKPPADAYSSPFNSYNPPDIKPNDSKNNGPAAFDYPPNNSQPPGPPITSYGPPDDVGQQPPPPSVSYGTPVKDSGPPGGPSLTSYVANSYGPPQQPPPDVYGPPDGNPKPPKDSSKPDSDNKPPSDGKFPEYVFHPPLVDSPPQDDSPPPKKPESSYFVPPVDNSDNSYYAPPMSNGNGNHPQMMPDNDGAMDNGDDQSHSQPSSDYGPPISATVEPPDSGQPPYLDHPPTDHDYHHHHHPPPAPSMAESDLSPPPAGVPYGKIPQYLDHEPNDHDLYHFGHHDVYHEVHTTTTTTEAPRAGHYSYYYLGRKLWYIPLYFSVYFIVYVTVLILKSIARHKIQFTQNFERSRTSRQLDIDVVNNTVTNAIEKQEKLYM